MEDAPRKKSTPVTHRGFSLASLATLTTVVATLLASTDPQRWQAHYAWLTDQGPWAVLLFFGGAAVVGLLIGLVHWVVNGFRWRTLLIATTSGALAACIAALILVAPGPFWRSLVCIVVLIMTTNLLRLGAE